MKEIEEGRNGIKGGVIGEIGCNYPLTDLEKKCLIAASKAQVSIRIIIFVVSDWLHAMLDFPFTHSFCY